MTHVGLSLDPGSPIAKRFAVRLTIRAALGIALVTNAVGCSVDPVQVLSPPDACAVELTQTGGISARAASAFSRGMGVGLRYNYPGVYTAPPVFEQRLTELGVQRINDTDSIPTAIASELGGLGLELHAFENISTAKQSQLDHGTYLTSYQLKHESSAPLATWEQRTVARLEEVRRTLDPSRKLELGSRATNSREIGELAHSSLDFIAIELFPRTKRPELAVGELLGTAEVPSSPPVWMTQGAYATDSLDGGVAPAVQSRYLLRMILTALSRGVQRVYVAQLANWGMEAAFDESLGLIDAKGTPKPAFDALTKWLRLLDDVGARKSLGSLRFSLAGAGSAQSALFQRQNGIFLLALWLAVDSVATETRAAVQLNLKTPIRQATVYRPERSPSIESRLANPESLDLELSDMPLLVELEPACLQD